MRLPSFVSLVAVSFLPISASAQSLNLSFGAGRAYTDNRNTLLGDQGFSAFIRVSSQRLPFLMDASYISMAQVPRVVYPCPSFAPTCGANQFVGPVRAVTLSPALQIADRHGFVSLQYRLGPSVSWLPDRQANTSAAAFGARVGASLVMHVGEPALVLSADYLRMFRDGQSPRWFVPLTLGLQF